MDKQQVIDLMESCKSDAEWNAACDLVKRTCGGYPDFWWKEIIQSGLGDRVMARWGGSTAIKVGGLTIK
jgi:hypothetical protein